MDIDNLHKWIANTFEKERSIDKKSFSTIPEDDLEHVKFLLDYLVSSGLVKTEPIGEETKYHVQNLSEIKKFLGLEKETIEKPALKESLVVSIPLSLSSKLRELKTKYPGINILELKDTLKLLIQNANDEICIASPFIEPDGIMYIWDELVSSTKRGVSVRLIMRDILVKKSYDFSYSKKIKGIMKLHELFEHNSSDPTVTIKIRDYGTSITQQDNTHHEGVHQKMFIVDKKFAYIGSGEIRLASFITNGETGALFVGREAEFWHDFFEMFWKNAQEIPKEILESEI